MVCFSGKVFWVDSYCWWNPQLQSEVLQDEADQWSLASLSYLLAKRSILLLAVGASSNSAVSLPAPINSPALHLQLCTTESQPFQELGFIAFSYCWFLWSCSCKNVHNCASYLWLLYMCCYAESSYLIFMKKVKTSRVMSLRCRW